MPFRHYDKIICRMKVIVASTSTLERSFFAGSVAAAAATVKAEVEEIVRTNPQELAKEVVRAISETSESERVVVAVNTNSQIKANSSIFAAIAKLFESGVGLREIFIGSAETARTDHNDIVPVRSAAELANAVSKESSDRRLVAPIYRLSLNAAPEESEHILKWLQAVVNYKTPVAAETPAPVHH